jgi:hypothetical protein
LNPKLNHYPIQHAPKTAKRKKRRIFSVAADVSRRKSFSPRADSDGADSRPRLWGSTVLAIVSLSPEQIANPGEVLLARLVNRARAAFADEFGDF